MAETNGDEPADAALVFRMGLHLGDLIVDGDDLYGDGVNVAARLEGEAPAGGILISRNVRDAVAGRVKATFEDLGGLVAEEHRTPRSRVQREVGAVGLASGRDSRGNSPACDRTAGAAAVAGQALDRRAALPEHERRSRAGVLRDGRSRGRDHRRCPRSSI